MLLQRANFQGSVEPLPITGMQAQSEPQQHSNEGHDGIVESEIQSCPQGTGRGRSQHTSVKASNCMVTRAKNSRFANFVASVTVLVGILGRMKRVPVTKAKTVICVDRNGLRMLRNCNVNASRLERLKTICPRPAIESMLSEQCLWQRQLAEKKNETVDMAAAVFAAFA